jgi:hypothetical protein
MPIVLRSAYYLLRTVAFCCNQCYCFFMASSKLSSADVLRDAEQAPTRETLSEHRQTISVLRTKKYTWREIAQFLVERGVATDHTSVFRFMKRQRESSMEKPATFKVPSAEEYKKALIAIQAEITKPQRDMLELHYKAHNRTATFTELARAAGYDNNNAANRLYGNLGKLLGDKLDMTFATYEIGGKQRDFFSSAMGSGSQYRQDESGHFQLIMHHELAKALGELGWFRD